MYKRWTVNVDVTKLSLDSSEAISNGELSTYSMTGKPFYSHLPTLADFHF